MIKDPSIMQEEIITRLRQIILEQSSCLRKDLLIEDYTERGIRLKEGTIYDIDKVFADYKILFDNGLVIFKI